MKRVITLLLVVALCLTFFGCGKKMCSIEGCGIEATEDDVFEELYCSKHLANKKAFVISKEAYDSISQAYDICDRFGDDIYEAWRIGIYEEDEISEGGIEYLSSKLSLNEEELSTGFAYVVSTYILGQDWESVSDENKSDYIEAADELLKAWSDDLFTICVWSVSGAYVTNGEIEKAQSELSKAKSKMKELSDKFFDYEHYPNLKKYYTSTDSYFEFCQNPEGSFEQVKDTINDYTNDIRDYRSDLDYIFED